MDESIVKQIWDRAGEFFPALKSLDNKIDKIRIGHRPYSKSNFLPWSCVTSCDIMPQRPIS